MKSERKKYGKYEMILVFAVAILFLFCSVISAQAADMGEINSGETRTGNIASEGQTDSFTFYGEAGQAVVIEMAAAVGGDLGPAIYLYRPNGTIETQVVGDSYANRVVIREHQLEQTGVYTLVSSASWAYQTSTTGNYSISLTKIPPTPPLGIYNPFPANGATITNLNQSFRWDAVAGATGYDLYFGEDVITPLEKIGENLTSPEMPFPDMGWDKIYYWHVEAHIHSSTIQGPYWWFKTEEKTNITISPPTATLNIGGTQQFTATVYDQYGNTMPDVVITWASTNTSVGTVSPSTATTGASGTATTTFTALAEGTTSVMAGSGTVSDTASVTVTEVLKPTISINTDKTSYAAGDTMRLSLDVTNPGDARTVSVKIGVEKPDGSTKWFINKPSVTLSAGLEFSKAKLITLPSIPAGTYIWHAQLSDPITGGTISEDTASWEFVGRSIETADIAEVLEQTTVEIDFDG